MPRTKAKSKTDSGRICYFTFSIENVTLALEVIPHSVEIEQLPAQRHVAVARAGRDEQDVDLALAEIPLRAVQVQAQFALSGQQAH